LYYKSWADYQAGNPSDTVSYAYDILRPDGLHNTVTDSLGTTDYLYNAENDLIVATTPEGTINYAYDRATGNVTETSTNSTDVTYQYDTLGNLTNATVNKLDRVALTQPQQTAYQYDAVGNVTGVTNANGVQTVAQYDVMNRLTKLQDSGATGQLLASYQYTLLANGQVGTDSESRRNVDGSYATSTDTFTYDALNRVTQESYTSNVAGTGYTNTYQFDLAGNLLQRSTTPAGAATTLTVNQYNALDELTQSQVQQNGTTLSSTSYVYDANGSLTSATSTTGATAAYTYDLRNQMVGATISRNEGGHTVQIQASYKYDTAGNRVQETSVQTIDGGAPTTLTKILLVDQVNPTGYAQVLEERPSAGALPSTTYILGKNVISQRQGGTDLFLLSDRLGSTRLVSNGTGQTQAFYNYDAFGNVLNATIGLLAPPATVLVQREQEVYLRGSSEG
jgi:YD repeat-containing protein